MESSTLLTTASANNLLETFTVGNVTDADRLAALNSLNDRMTRTVLPVTIFVTIEATLGFLGNVIVLYVFLFHYKRCNFRYFVLCLAFTDLTSSLTTMPGEVITQTHWYKYPYPMICKIKSFFNVFTVSAEAFALVMIAVDRYLKVCWPFGFQISSRFARFLILLIYLFATILSIPVAILWGVHSETKTYNGINITVTICEKDQDYKDSDRPLTYTTTIEGIIGTTLVIMFILYMLVARRLLLNKSSTNMSISKPMSKTGTAHDENRDNGISLDKVSTSKGKNSPDSAYSSGASSSGGPGLVQQKGYISDDALSSDMDTAVSDIGHKKNRTPCRNRGTTRGLGRNLVNRTRLRRKTMIMVILTIIFIFTAILYLTLLSFIAEGILETLNDSQKAAYFFFFRFVFINHVINPVVYGLLDPTFKRVLMGCRKGTLKNTSTGGGKDVSSHDS